MDRLLTTLAAGVMPILVIVLAVLAYRHNMKKWRSGIDAELQASLSQLGVGTHTLIIDKLTSPGTNRTADVYRILRNDHEHYFLFLKLESNLDCLSR